MNSRSARPPKPRFKSWRPREASSLRRIDQDLAASCEGSSGCGQIDRTASVTSWPNPPVAKITRARVNASRSQVWVDRSR